MMSENNNDHFDFVEDKVLKKNLNRVFVDIIDLVSLMDNQSEAIQINLRRAIVLYTASIIEAIIHLLVINKASDLFFQDERWSYLEKPYKLHEYQDSRDRKIQIISAKRYKKVQKISRSTQFKTMTRIALRSGLISSDLSEDIDYVRGLRNRIHLASLEDVEKKHTSGTLEKVFGIARKTKKLAEELLRA